MRWFFPERLLRSVPETKSAPMSAAQFAQQLMQNLDIRYEIAEHDLERIPQRGGGLITSNHPFGFLEGLILLSLLERIRPDYRIVANGLLSTVPALRERLIFVNPFRDHADSYENGRGLRAAMEWVQGGGLLAMFPAGEVAHLNWGERPVADPKWNTAAARIARRSGCITLPMFFEGANSRRFQMVGTIHPCLRTLNLAHELANKSRQTVHIRAGTPITAAVLKRYGDAEAATDYLRARTYLLGSRAVRHARFSTVKFRRQRAVAQASPANLVKDEMEGLPPERVLAKGDDFTVYLASTNEIPHTLHEIGRCRELTYREVGEGTGRAVDIDEFDAYYRHIVLWHAGDQRVAGAYRVAATLDVFARHGIDGLYTNTLFHYEPAFFSEIGPALELGRSFICRDYQKRYSPLLLLWKGILNYVARRPECAVLFGAVSISSDYQSLSRTLIVNFLNGYVTHGASHLIQPRMPFRGNVLVPKHIRTLGRLVPNLDELSSSIQDLETDGKGLPVLMRQYLKVGGELLGFNVDRHFSNVLDVLVMADLRTASGPMLERCMGRDGAQAFRSWHGKGEKGVASHSSTSTNSPTI
jgi:putative hemolysin